MHRRATSVLGPAETLVVISKQANMAKWIVTFTYVSWGSG